MLLKSCVTRTQTRRSITMFSALQAIQVDGEDLGEWLLRRGLAAAYPLLQLRVHTRRVRGETGPPRYLAHLRGAAVGLATGH
jgi:hypothetical protein